MFLSIFMLILSVIRLLSMYGSDTAAVFRPLYKARLCALIPAMARRHVFHPQELE